MYRRKPGKRGGRRARAGRKRIAARPQVKHRTRRELDGRTPVHITLRVMPDVARLRTRDQHQAIRAAFARTCTRDDFRICQYSIQGNHLHLVVEAANKRALASGMTGFQTSCARRLNAIKARTGRVFADRYHVRYLTNLAQVRRALCYVLNNWRRHGETTQGWRTDPCSSADAFDGWTCGQVPPPSERDGPAPVAKATFWVLREGWRRYGLIHPREVPGAR